MKILGGIDNMKTTENVCSSRKLDQITACMNRYSLLFHALLSCFLVFVIECISRRDFLSACSFIGEHTTAYLYNSFIIFASLSVVYFLRRRLLARLLISALWVFLGTVNGVILSKRVTPFGYTDLKCLGDLFAMQNTKYFTMGEAATVIVCVGLFLAFCIWLFIKGPKFQGNIHKIFTPLMVAAIFLMVPVTTKAAQSTNVVASYFSNIAMGYENYGFVYGFSSSVVDRGMSKPDNYSEETIKHIQASVPPETTAVEDAPNIIVVLLESFVDPYDVNFLQYSQDPTPNFHRLLNDYSSGYLTVPVVGAGTANTEFEILTGMGMKYFGTGEYPYKTTLKQTDCESIASVLSDLGYGTHVVHNNGGNFYSRANAFSMMGFDSFTSKECMNIHEYTPLGSWPTDNILISETLKAMNATPDQSDFVYTITVQGHGDYPTEKIIENPEINVSGAKDEASNNAWEYYINEIHEVDKFIGNLTAALSQRDEKTIVVFFGDHLPTMGLTDEDMASGDIFKTKYITWNNFDLPKQDKDCTSYELLANITDQLDIHAGTMFSYIQSQGGSASYSDNLEQLQYDLLYGKRYAYNGVDKYPATELAMGVDEVILNGTMKSDNGKLCIYGSNFTPWTKIYVNGEKVSTSFLATSILKINQEDVEDGDILTANIVSGSTIFRSSNELVYDDPDVPDIETETELPTEAE
ncbi:MAG: LTA synthase family protein [Lachnospiraceae bacterium]|nr:LTA synthase family protein [Lachnospiraceae bacterium]